MRLLTGTIAGLLFLTFISAPICAQWFKYPTPGAPRTPGGEVDLSAPVPRLTNGKPDLSGVWMTADSACGAFTLENRDHSFFWTRKSGS